MKKIVITLCLIFVFGLLCGCVKVVDPSLYVPETRGLISTDKGNNYRENLKAIYVGEEFYLKFEVQISTTDKQNKKPKANIIPFTVTIPATDIFDCTLTDFSGNVQVTPASDSINNILRYDFRAVASSSNPQKYTVIFQCKARDEGNHEIKVTYGKQVNEVYSKTMTLVYNN